ncbi:hypothetical protein [Photobacterium halotolerans]|uniref:Uncharacterized protein n=1 Tax=Photobacterium halotolerans TaxID=265726 RepID=A0A7X5ASP8_9GAMM|nr:hypothetical protein [Photobacterium halotolerans]NAW64516.1 hypothetical protein [Photobacterium halotolerans]
MSVLTDLPIGSTRRRLEYLAGAIDTLAGGVGGGTGTPAPSPEPVNYLKNSHFHGAQAMDSENEKTMMTAFRAYPEVNPLSLHRASHMGAPGLPGWSVEGTMSAPAAITITPLTDESVSYEMYVQAYGPERAEILWGLRGIGLLDNATRQCMFQIFRRPTLTQGEQQKCNVSLKMLSTGNLFGGADGGDEKVRLSIVSLNDHFKAVAYVASTTVQAQGAFVEFEANLTAIDLTGPASFFAVVIDAPEKTVTASQALALSCALWFGDGPRPETPTRYEQDDVQMIPLSTTIAPGELIDGLAFEIPKLHMPCGYHAHLIAAVTGYVTSNSWSPCRDAHVMVEGQQIVIRGIINGPDLGALEYTSASVYLHYSKQPNTINYFSMPDYVDIT